MSDKKQYASRNAVAQSELQHVEVVVPEWGGIVVCKELTPRQAAMVNMIADAIDKEHGKLSRTLVAYVVLATYDGDGKNLFTSDDANMLASKSFRVVSRLAEEIMQMSGLMEKSPKS